VHLTPRERAVARYLLGGWTYESIGYQLGISHYTVAAHARGIVKAAGASSTHSAVLSILRDPAALSAVMEVPV
jgi:DNA-binding NarL/FixJ family response regulator